MKRVAVLGGGPAGSMAAARLAAAGLETVLLDEKLAWEKPCGGGVTCKAYTRYPFLRENGAPRKVVTESRLSDPMGGSVDLRLAQPLLVYSRYELNKLLLERAARAGARIEQTRVTGLERRGSGWSVKTRGGTLDADFAVVATGARNTFRGVGTEWSAEDAMCAMGYWVPEEREHIDIQFLPDMEGYIWVFPRCGHLSVGICGKGEPARKMRAELERYMAEKGIPLKNASFYGHLIPALEPASWKRNRVGGEGWVAVGDAAGLVDPVTGEGLYYAIRSGDLAADAVLSENHGAAAIQDRYRALIQEDFVEDLTFGARLAKRFFRGRYFFGSGPARMIELMRWRPGIREVVQDLFSGAQSYTGLKGRVLAAAPGWVGALAGVRGED